jgi:hypothetical protein
MPRLRKTLLAAGVLLAVSGIAAQYAISQNALAPARTPTMKALHAATPYQENNGQVPSSGEYSGPLFKLSHDWPGDPLPPMQHAPWQDAIGNKPITVDNASAYADALKAAVADNARQLIMHYDQWDAAKAGWYNEPWLGSLREAIRGTYPAGTFGPSIFPGTGLRTTFDTHVLTYYDQRAAYSLQHFWGDSAMKPTLETANAQFQEGAIIVKAAVFASTDPKLKLGWWDAMEGAQAWDMYLPVGKQTMPQVWPGYVAQFDIIVKDTQSSPTTGWVFMTLVYDKDAPGDDPWDKMVPLGVQWGNDPQATEAGMPLKENWNNPAAPLYATQTLGWGGRLTGPNDGGRNDIAVDGKVMRNAPDSSCMSCHSTAQWNVARHRMDSFLLPSFATDAPPGFQLCGDDGKPNPNGDVICSPAPGSKEWMKWFQNRPGTEAMDPGSFATDFDEVFSFKSLKLWWAAVGPADRALPMLMRSPAQGPRFNQYTGAPLPGSAE